MNADQILAFRLARSGPRRPRRARPRRGGGLPGVGLRARRGAARARGAGRGRHARRLPPAVDGGELVVAYIVRGAIHALAPGDLALYGRALIARDDGELATQLGRQMQRLAAEHGFASTDALDEVAAATQDALRAVALDKNALHEALRGRVRAELMPWCQGCQSHHVAPMLWRYATSRPGARLDSERRYTLGEPAARPPARRRSGASCASTARRRRAVRRVGRAREAARQRLWDEVAGELARSVGRRGVDAARGPGRARVAAGRQGPPDPARRPVPPEAQPGAARAGRRAAQAAVPAGGKPGRGLGDGRLAGLWRAKAKGRKIEITVEPLARPPRAELDDEAQRVAALRGAAEAKLVVA